MEGGRDDYLFWMNAQNIFFQLPKLNKYCLGAELASAQQVIKKLKMDHLWVYTHSHFMPQRLQNVIKTTTTTTITKRACQLLKFWIHVFDQRDKHLLEIWCKNKVLIKSYGAWNWRNELLGHPALFRLCCQDETKIGNSAYRRLFCFLHPEAL